MTDRPYHQGEKNNNKQTTTTKTRKERRKDQRKEGKKGGRRYKTPLSKCVRGLSSVSVSVCEGRGTLPAKLFESTLHGCFSVRVLFCEEREKNTLYTTKRQRTATSQ